jgi:hypothetical protein
MPGFDVNQGYIGCARRVGVAACADACPPHRPTRTGMSHYDRLIEPTS